MIRMFTRLAPLDARSIGRDGLMRILPAVPLLVVLPVRFVLPVLLARLGDVFGMPLDAYYPGIASAALLLISPSLYGLLVGFLLLDQRDENTLTALRVTPLPVRSYLLYRLAAPTALGYVVSAAALLLAGLPGANLPALLVAALVAALHTPLVALALACFAANKVQGLALMKAGSVLLAAPMAAMFVPGAWQYAFGVVPTFWPGTLYRLFQQGSALAWPLFAVALAYQMVLILALARRFRKAEL